MEGVGWGSVALGAAVEPVVDVEVRTSAERWLSRGEVA